LKVGGRGRKEKKEDCSPANTAPGETAEALKGLGKIGQFLFHKKKEPWRSNCPLHPLMKRERKRD